MLDELDRLRSNTYLASLLAHYNHLAEVEPENWQDRLMQMEGVTSTEMSKLHGQLIAFGWIEQNTGHLSVLRPGEVPLCYRITAAGRKANKLASGSVSDEPEPTVLKFHERARPKVVRKKAG
jgi:hypothetical protein